MMSLSLDRLEISGVKDFIKSDKSQIPVVDHIKIECFGIISKSKGCWHDVLLYV